MENTRFNAGEGIFSDSPNSEATFPIDLPVAHTSPLAEIVIDVAEKDVSAPSEEAAIFQSIIP
jgi:hypothetical protein